MSSAIVLVLVSAAVVACGGQVETGSADGGGATSSSSGGVASSGSGSGSSSGGGSSGSASGSGGSGSSSGPIPPCPANTPAAGGACSGPGDQKCAYFEGNGTCQAFVCDASSIWESAPEGC
ncbi:MAG TPA: hypothetical protein VGG39_16180 [Polyangiaceae bacterium]